jgi:hypothetical protein
MYTYIKTYTCAHTPGQAMKSMWNGGVRSMAEYEAARYACINTCFWSRITRNGGMPVPLVPPFTVAQLSSHTNNQTYIHTYIHTLKHTLVRVSNSANLAGAVRDALHKNQATITADAQLLHDAENYAKAVGKASSLPVDASEVRKTAVCTFIFKHAYAEYIHMCMCVMYAGAPHTFACVYIHTCTQTAGQEAACQGRGQREVAAARRVRRLRD